MSQKLNKQQKQAVDHNSSPLLIIAGAGTGKTTVITQKIANLISSGLAEPEEILALTFTDKAAGEMQERVDELVDIGYSELHISTFHSFCQNFLEEYALDIGLSNKFQLFTQIDSWLLLRDHIYTLDLDYYRPVGNPSRHIHEMLGYFSSLKDELITPEIYKEYSDNLEINLDEKKGEIVEEIDIVKHKELSHAYSFYNKLLLDKAALDFGDLLLYTLQILSTRENIAKQISQKYKYILIDEFQDVNWAQYELIKKLSQSAMLTVVGDDDQSIYAFRGSNVSVIMRFTDDYKDAESIVLNQNYRSKQEILDVAYTSVQHNNPDRLEAKLGINKQLSSQYTNTDVHAVKQINYATLQDEVKGVITEIKRLKDTDKTGKVSWDDFAILVRANTHVDPFINGLESMGIPYEYVASSGLFKQPIIIDCLAYLQAVERPIDAMSIYRLLHLPSLDFSSYDIQYLVEQSKKKTVSYISLIKHADTLPISDKGKESTKKLYELIYAGAELGKKEKPTTVLYGFLEQVGYLEYLIKKEHEGERDALRSIEHLKQFFDFLDNYESKHNDVTIHHFLKYYANLVQAGDEGSLYQPGETKDSVNILTVHGSKGLEYKYVFIVNLIEGRFPSRKRSKPMKLPDQFIHEENLANSDDTDVHIQEERRLFYVALTRAKERVYLMSGDNYGGKRNTKISRFIAELGFDQSGTPAIPIGLASKIGSRKKVENKFEVDYELPKKYSFSQLKTYETCPYQYKLSYLLRLQTKGRGVFSFGKTVHSALEKFYKKVQKTNAPQQESLFNDINEKGVVSDNTNKKIKIPSLQELLEFYDEAWQSEWYESQKQKNDYYEKGKKILTTYYNLHEKEDKWRIPQGLEKWFNIKIGKYTLHGQIDRVDVLDDSSLEIIDYKTGRPKEKLATEDKDQLLLYQLAAQQLPEFKHVGKVSRLTFYYLDEGGIETSFLGTEKDLEKIKNKVIDTIDKISSKNFNPTPNKFACSYCDFKNICEFRD